MRIVASVTIDRPASQVWAYVADHGNDSSWRGGRVEPGRRLHWRAHDRQKQLEGSRLVEPSGPASSRFTQVVEGLLLGPSRVLEPVVAWLLQRQATQERSRPRHSRALVVEVDADADQHHQDGGGDPGLDGDDPGASVSHREADVDRRNQANESA